MRPTLVVCLLALLAGCSRHRLDPALPAPLPWQPVRWLSVEVDGTTFPHAGLLIPSRLPGDDRVYQLHLDLGAHTRGAFGIPVQRTVMESFLPEDTTTIRARLMALGNRDDSLQGVPIDQRPRLGSFGVTMLETRVALFDLTRRRLALLEPGQRLPAVLEERVRWSPLRYRDGLVEIAVRFGDQTEWLFLDTGSQLASLWMGVGVERFLERGRGEPLAMELPTTGGRLRLEGRRSLATVIVGQEPLGRPVIWTMQSGPLEARFEGWPFNLRGVVGLDLFGDRVVILDLRRGRLGLLR